MKKALRMVYNSYISDIEFEKNLKAVKSNIDVVDEITLFTEAWHHGYVPLDVAEKTAGVLKKRIEAYKGIGVKKVGINVLCTIGHTEDGSGMVPKGDMQYVMNIDGVESGSCPCPSDDRFLKYIEKRYVLYANTGADFLWLDDDFRVGNHGVAREACFCPECLKKFNKKYGTDYDIEYIRKNWKNDTKLKEKWMASAADIQVDLVKTIRNAIESVNSGMDIGFMNGMDNMNKNCIEASGAVMVRPGGGFYSDRNPKQMFEKAFCIQHLMKNYHEDIKDIQYEYETYNFRSFEKSNHISEVETSLTAMLGCNGILYNRWDWERADGFYTMMRKSAKKWDVLTKANEGCKNAGVFCVNPKNAAKLNEIGQPVTVWLENSSAAFVVGGEWNKFDDKTVEKILCKNVLTDGKGLEILNSRGFVKYTCGKVEKVYKNGIFERFSNHEFNGEYAGSARHISMDIFYEADAYALKPEGNAQGLSFIESIVGDVDLSMYIAESEMGTKIAVDGCLMPLQMNTEAKQCQLMKVFKWLSGHKMHMFFDSTVQVVPTVTVDKNGGMNVMLINPSFDETGSFDLIVRNAEKFKAVSDNGEKAEVKQFVQDKESVIHLDSIKGWGYLVLTNK